MAKQKKKTTKYEAVISLVAKAPKRGLTAEKIAERSGVNLSTVRTYLYTATSAGDVFVIGKVEGKRGRPALLYSAVLYSE